MNPYEVLDVSPKLTLREINVRYRELMLLHHPDLHTAEGPAAVAAAEQKTRELTEAMAMMRRQHPREGVRVGAEPEDTLRGAFAGAEGAVTYAWEQDTSRPMACPLCGNVFERGVADVETHIFDVHQIDLYKQGKPQRRKRRILTKGERKAIRTVSILVAFFVFVIVAILAGSLDRLSKGQFDPFIPLIVLFWGVVLARVVLKQR